MIRRSLLLPLAALIGLCGAAAAFASNASPEPACITAGRLDGDGRWAPQFRAVRLLDEAGRAIAAPGKTALARVRSVELTEPALLSRCDGNQPLARGDESPAAKAPVPAATPGRLTVSAVGFPKLQTGGSLVELQVSVPADRVVMVTR